MYQLSFIGTGNMGGALVRAAAAGGHGADCLLTNRTLVKAQALADQCGCAVAQSNAQAAEEGYFILLGVKPYLMAGVLAEIAPVLARRKQAGDRFVLVSMAAGLTVDTLKQMAGDDYPVLRIMPNTPCAIGKGMVLVTPGPGVEPAEVDRLCDLLAAAGRFDPIDESLMDSGSVIAGCTGAWACMFIEALADGAVQTGMPRPKAVEYAAQAVLGAAALVLESGKHPGQLKDEVCSPGGSTIVGVHAMETGGVRAAAMDAVTQAFARTKEMGKS